MNLEIGYNPEPTRSRMQGWSLNMQNEVGNRLQWSKGSGVPVASKRAEINTGEIGRFCTTIFLMLRCVRRVR
jgi:hypothetical protein